MHPGKGLRWMYSVPHGGLLPATPIAGKRMRCALLKRIWQEDVVQDGDNPFQWLFEAVTGGIAELFEGGNKDLVATRIPLEGNIDDIETPLWPAIGAIIRNAFIKSLDIKVDETVTLPLSTGTNDRQQQFAVQRKH